MHEVSGEEGGRPHITVGKPPKPEDRIKVMHVLVAVMEDGGEGIYGHKIGDHMFSFAVDREDLKEMLEKHIRDVGSVEVCRREGTRLEWREYAVTDKVEVIT